VKETYKDYFSQKTAAERYAKGRPRFHFPVIERIKKYLALDEPFALALDVGCGTGLSSAALKEIAERVVGVDVSAAMLRQAPAASGIEYALASAENLPFGAAEFDLVTISQAIHWIDKQRFYAEADRVLKPGALVVAYDNLFQGEMLGNSEFKDWYQTRFLREFPVPPRGARAFSSASENARDFVLLHEESNENALEFSAREFVDYLVTISNVIAKVENGARPIAEIDEWLTNGIAPFFNGSRRKFLFISPIWFLRRNY
jgi:ubiquinone/menaquinone biosynthesis C-methylase UbiE